MKGYDDDDDSPAGVTGLLESDPSVGFENDTEGSGRSLHPLARYLQGAGEELLVT